ncbi:MAG: hypothetical protein GY876_02795 [Planctomycetes bacterium]|nr:hypothetical protein [Planctomycetota bacterium]
MTAAQHQTDPVASQWGRPCSPGTVGNLYRFDLAMLRSLLALSEPLRQGGAAKTEGIGDLINRSAFPSATIRVANDLLAQFLWAPTAPTHVDWGQFDARLEGC